MGATAPLRYAKECVSAGSILKVLEEWKAKRQRTMPANVPHLAAEATRLGRG